MIFLILFLSAALVILFFLIWYKYCCCIRDALKLTRDHHSINPDLAFVLLVPLVNVFLHIFFLCRLPTAVAARFKAIGLDPHAYLFWLGIAPVVASLLSLVVDSVVMGPCALAAWLIWWITLHGVNQTLDRSSHLPAISATTVANVVRAAGSSGDQRCEKCRQPLQPTDHHCGQCGYAVRRT
jgi:hypothetical protein